MEREKKLSEIINELYRTKGRQALLNEQFVVAYFMDMAPSMKRERELLRLFLLCGGAKEVLRIQSASAQEQKNSMERLARKFQADYGVSEEAACRICAEFYLGVTGSQWTYAKHNEMKNLDVWESVTITQKERSQGKNTSIFVEKNRVDVRSPANVAEGQTICFQQKGMLNSATGQRGDLYITIHIQENSSTVLWKIIAATAAAVAAVLLLLLVFRMPKDNGETGIPENSTGQTIQTQDSTGQTIQEQDSTGQTEQETVHVHSWVDATYTAPRTCSGCGATSGLSLGMPLAKCKVVDDSQAPEGTDIFTGTLRDESGVEHESAVMLWVSTRRSLVNVEHVLYELAGNYDELDGVIALADRSDKDAGVRFYIYGDGKLLYKSTYIRGSETERIQIDVSGVYELRVECETDESCDSYGLLDALLYVGE